MVWGLLGQKSNDNSGVAGVIAVDLMECSYGLKGNCIALGPNPKTTHIAVPGPALCFVFLLDSNCSASRYALA